MPSSYRRPLKVLFATALAVGAFAAFPRLAAAQTISIVNAPASIGRQDASGTGINLRPQNNYPYGISLSDCVNDYRITFPIQIAGVTANNAVEVWAGTTDCSDYTQRANTTQTCWRVANNLGITANQTVPIKVRDIIAQPATKTQSYVNQDASICGTVDFTTFSVYFIVTMGNGNTVTSVKQDIQADTIGPAAVTNVNVTQGDTRLHVTWDAVGTVTDEAGTSTSSDLTTATQVAVYYQEASTGGGGSQLDAGTTLTCNDGAVTIEDAGQDDSGDAQTTTVTTDGGCKLTPLESSGSGCSAPGFLSTGPDSTVNSFTVGANSSEATINGLTNGTSYAVAVAAQDAFLNPGTISSPSCQTPIQLNDFFETYRNDGGLAGGGCSLDMLGAPAGGATVAVVAFSSMLALARRRRHKPSSENTEGQGEE